jgi:hypothetical protein
MKAGLSKVEPAANSECEAECSHEGFCEGFVHSVGSITDGIHRRHGFHLFSLFFHFEWFIPI